MKLAVPPIIVLYGFITVSMASWSKAKTAMDYKDTENLEKTPKIRSNCEEAFSSQIFHCIQPFSRKVKQYTNIKPENPFVYQIFIKHACRKYKKMLLCVHTYLTNCPTTSSYSTVQKSLDQAWVPVVNQMCDINTNSSKDLIQSNTDQTVGTKTVSVSTQNPLPFLLHNDLPTEGVESPPPSGKEPQDSISVITFLDRIVLPELVMDSGVPPTLNSKDKHFSDLSQKSKDFRGSARGRGILHWLYIVIGSKDSDNKVQYLMDSNRAYNYANEAVSMSQKSSACHLTFSALGLVILMFVYCL